MNRCASKPISSFKINALKDISILGALNTCRDLMRSCYGPYGKGSLIHNNKGGNVTLTTSCRRLTSSVSVSCPVLKILFAACNEHIKHYHDSGLLVFILSLEVIIRALESDLPQILMCRVIDQLIPNCMDYMNKISIDADIDHIHRLLALSSSVIYSKPLCLLTADDQNHLSRLLLQAVLNDDKNLQSIRFVAVEGLDPIKTEIFHGVLIPCYNETIDLLSARKNVKIVVFSISLSGDTDLLPQANYEVTDLQDIDQSVIQLILNLIPMLVSLKVDIVLCQKVIHPRIRIELTKHGIYALERLGLEATLHVHTSIGGVMINSLTDSISDKQCAIVGSMSYTEIHGKYYLQVNPVSEQNNSSTIFLCHRTEESLNELKVTCQTAMQVLKQTIEDPRMLNGGGQWQREIAELIKENCLHSSQEWSKQLKCTPLQTQNAMEIVVCSLTSISGLLQSADPSDGIYDCFNSSLSALRTALGIASMVLSINNIVMD